MGQNDTNKPGRVKRKLDMDLVEKAKDPSKKKAANTAVKNLEKPSQQQLKVNKERSTRKSGNTSNSAGKNATIEKNCGWEN